MAAIKNQGRLTIELEPYELKRLFQVLNALPKETQNAIRDSAQGLSKRLAGQLMMFAGSAPAPQTKLVAQSIKTPRDRLIKVTIGGSMKVGRKYGGEVSKNGKSRVRQDRAPAGALLWGTEYGSQIGKDTLGRNYTNRFGVPRNPNGYWITKATDYYVPIVAKEYQSIVQGAINDLEKI